MKRLRIGISANFSHPDSSRAFYKGKTLWYLEASMGQWVMSSGALPVLLPVPQSDLDAASLIADVDGLLLTGGADVFPGHYGEEPARPEWIGDAVRDRYEFGLIEAAIGQRKPVLGVCRGHQILNVALGGTLWQDIATMHPAKRTHRDWEVYDQLGHAIRIEAGSWLGQWAGCGHGGGIAHVNSVHHQAVKALGKGLVPEAYSEPDRIVEAYRLDARHADGRPMSPQEMFVYGVQFHPEFMFSSPRSGQLDTRPLLDAFLSASEACRLRAR